MKKPVVSHEHAQARYTSYVIGFVLSLATTLGAFFLVINKVWPPETLMYIVIGIAALQLLIQSVFFLHLGQGKSWKSVTFWFTLLMVLIIGVGSVWIMHNLNYNMMDMNPEQMLEYMIENQGI